MIVPRGALSAMRQTEPREAKMQEQKSVRHYDAQYGQFASDLYALIRTDAFGEDIGQNGWLTSEEHDLFIKWLDLDPTSHLLDVASGSGGTTLRIARLTGCSVQGIDIHPQGVSAAGDAVRRQNLSGRAAFQVGDACRPLPFRRCARILNRVCAWSVTMPHSSTIAS